MSVGVAISFAAADPDNGQLCEVLWAGDRGWRLVRLGDGRTRRVHADDLTTLFVRVSLVKSGVVSETCRQRARLLAGVSYRKPAKAVSYVKAVEA